MMPRVMRNPPVALVILIGLVLWYIIDVFIKNKKTAMNTSTNTLGGSTQSVDGTVIGLYTPGIVVEPVQPFVSDTNVIPIKEPIDWNTVKQVERVSPPLSQIQTV